MKDGVLSNNDLNVADAVPEGDGSGQRSTCRSSTLDYRLVAAVLKIPREGADAAQMQDMVDAQIPVKVTGLADRSEGAPGHRGLSEEDEAARKKVEEKLKDKLERQAQGYLQR